MILDTNAVSAVFAGDPQLAEVLGGETRHHLPVIAIGEYRYGLGRSRQRDRLARLLASLIRESIILPVDEGTAIAYSEIREALRQTGRPIPENDVWIAALALQHGQPVASRDEHFDAVEGLERITW